MPVTEHGTTVLLIIMCIYRPPDITAFAAIEFTSAFIQGTQKTFWLLFSIRNVELWIILGLNGHRRLLLFGMLTKHV